MPKPRGRTLSLSLPRRFVCDLVHFAQQVPTVPVQRRMNLAPLVAARQAASPRPSWCTLFTKAYARVAARRAELRRMYLSFPYPRLYEHPCSVASIAFERQFAGEEGVFFAPLRSPDELSLAELDARLKMYREQPVEEITPFRRILKVSRLPRPIRRLAWWIGLNAWGSRRAHYMGTFGVSVYSSLGAASLHPLSPATTSLNYGVIEADGSVDVRIIYDHRVMDGSTVARALADLEGVLLEEMVAELGQLRMAA